MIRNTFKSSSQTSRFVTYISLFMFMPKSKNNSTFSKISIWEKGFNNLISLSYAPKSVSQFFFLDLHIHTLLTHIATKLPPERLLFQLFMTWFRKLHKAFPVEIFREFDGAKEHKNRFRQNCSRSQNRS